MNELLIDNKSLPVISGCDFMAANEDFFHADRTADFNVLIYVTDGVIYVTEDETDIEIRAGEMLFLKAGVHHFGKRAIPKGTRWYYIHFRLNSEQCSNNFIPDKEKIPLYSYAEYSMTVPKRLKGLGGSDIEAQLKALTAYYHSEDKMKKWYINLKLFELLTEIACTAVATEERQSLSDKIEAYLAENFREPFSASVLEKEFFLSYKHLAAVFKKEKGITMQQCHTSMRMNYACKLLRSTLLPVGEIGEKAGFSDRLYFSRRFHTFTGKSPLEYRRNAVKL